MHDHWLIRRLAPDVAKIEMPTRPEDKRLSLAPALLRLMGRETANNHLGSFTGKDLEIRLKELNRDERWFAAATDKMTASTRADYATWAQHHPPRTADTD